MNEVLQEPLTVLCEEIGLAPPIPDALGHYVLEIDGHQLRFLALSKGRIVMIGLVGSVSGFVDKRRQSRNQLLSQCMTLQAARFSKQAIREVLTLEASTDEMVLWRSFEAYELNISSFLAAAESMLNEMEFWKNWLSNI